MNDKFEVKIESFAHNGFGVGKLNGKVVFVDFVLPDENVLVEKFFENKDYIKAHPVKIIEASRFRVNPKCQYYGVCGGCDMQHIDYEYQLKLKKRVLVNTLRRIAKVEIGDVEVVKSKDDFFYRKRASFKCSDKDWGFYKKNSRDFVKIDRCAIIDENLNRFISSNECIGDGIEVDDFGHINAKKMLLNLNSIKEGLYIKYQRGDFTQVNKDVNLSLIETVKSNIMKDDIGSVVEFYGGIGNFSIPLLLEGLRVANVELNASSIKSFKNNVKRLGLEDSAFSFRRDLNYNIDIPGNYDCALLDPPRTGAKKVVKWILKEKPKFVFYISCEPSTLSRDLKNLQNLYKIDFIKIFDMFPQTHHFETMVKMQLI